VEKLDRVGQVTYENITTHAHYMLCNQGKNRDTHSEYVILTAFERQQSLKERASVLGFHVHFLSCCNLILFIL